MAGTTDEAWWIEIDRLELLALVRKVASAGGVAVVSGKAPNGLTEAISLAQRVLEEQGFDCVTIACASNAGGFNNATVGIAERLQNAGGRGVPAHLLALRAKSPEDAIAYLEELIAQSGRKIAIVIDGVDEVQPLHTREVMALDDLAIRAGVPIVISTKRTLGKWYPVDRSRYLSLGAFSKEDVFRCVLRHAPEQLNMTNLDEIKAEVKQLMDRKSKTIVPRVAYTALRARTLES